MIDELFGVQLDKRFQRTNWGKRPLSSAQLAYAQRDTHYLFRLREYLLQKLEAAGLRQEAREIFAEQTKVKLPDTIFSPDDFWSINGVRQLSRPSQAVLKALNIYRDKEARKRDLPLFKVLGNKTLLEIAAQLPQDEWQLGGIRGMSRAQLQRYGRQILRIIAQEQKGPYPRPLQRPPRLPDDVMERYEQLHQWRKERGAARGVDSDVIMSRDALWAIAHANPQSEAELAALPEVGTWRLQSYGLEIIALLKHKNK
jgi:ribonuclease D